jgi:hypothetical protein
LLDLHLSSTLTPPRPFFVRMDRRLHPASTRLWGQIEMLYRCHLLRPGENPPLIAVAVACARLENAPALIVGKPSTVAVVEWEDTRSSLFFPW